MLRSLASCLLVPQGRRHVMRVLYLMLLQYDMCVLEPTDAGSHMICFQAPTVAIEYWNKR